MGYLAPRSRDALLIHMPFGALERQALGISLLKACLTESGQSCDVRYLSFLLAELIGCEEYAWVSNDLPYTAFAGDWAFAWTLYGERPAEDERYIEEVLRNTWHLDDASLRRLLRVRSLAGTFLDACMEAISWGDHEVVGFTSTFCQNIPSLALARRVKERFPKISIVFGGANWEGEMGRALHQEFPFVDYVCSGESEQSFPRLVAAAVDGAPRSRLAAIPGIVYRHGIETVATGQPRRVVDLDDLPPPDFSDYFHDLEHSTVASDILPNLLFETSRGCWWGARSHCTFCGLNGASMAFRSKSPERVLAELEELTARWKIDFVEVVDNILDMGYFKTVLPELARRGSPVELFYEVKSNLSREQVRILWDAGVHRIQPGIESLSDHVLRLMRKGTTALRNIQLMKWCREVGIGVDWNLLYGFPGETREDYDEMLELLPAIRFLQPPTACGPVRLDRFSPYFDESESFGLTDVRPIAPYRFLYPESAASLGRIAYYFDFEYAPGHHPGNCAAGVVAFCRQWSECPEVGTLQSTVRPDGSLVLNDSRSDATLPVVTLSGMEREVYEYCDEMRSEKRILAHLAKQFPSTEITAEGVRGFLDSLIDHRLMVRCGKAHLSLAIRKQPLAKSVDKLRLAA